MQTNIQHYISILRLTKKQLSARNKAETGIRYEWYALQRWGANFWQEFIKPKIVWLDLCDESRFSYSEDEMPLNTVFFITGDNLYSILGILNSKLILWYFRTCLGTTSGVGTNRWLKYTVEQLPIYKGETNAISEISKKITEIKRLNSQADTSAEEREIDRLVYQLYGLTEEEITIVEGSNA
ncbi:MULTISPECIES: TaqI-like C-terminal specificity domain-containing protein [Bacteroidales]|uniref:TaqI-like C-terminal specificity domain-containing protein n=1 Tax=Bacteroidales TaxID=171549 RepID=UPI0015558067|nr:MULTISPECIES: TaqI-like C-terminal specificity domain-containing protein [Bacteroidales]NPE37665.1 hypothetical protein [Prevotella sp. PCJ2]